VYLPAYSEDIYINHLKAIRSMSWKIFSKHTKTYKKEENVEVFPIDQDKWFKSLSSAYGAIIGGGFASTSEMLYLNKRLMVIPMVDQYEQKCNGVALEDMGVSVLPEIEEDFQLRVRTWLDSAKVISVDFPEHSEQLVKLALGI